MMMDIQKTFATAFVSDDIGETTVKGYLLTLLEAVLIEEESFSGKRPFGNSGWKRDIGRGLVLAGAIEGTIDAEYGDCDFDMDDADEALKLLVAAL